MMTASPAARAATPSHVCAHLALALLALGALALPTADANACTCVPPTREEATDQAPIIVFAEVEKIARVGDANVATVRVIERYKGLDEEVKHLTISSHREIGACGMLFEVGERRLFFTRGELPNLRTSTCALTQVMTHAPLSVLTFSLGDDVAPTDSAEVKRLHARARAQVLGELHQTVTQAVQVCGRVRSFKGVTSASIDVVLNPNGRVELDQLTWNPAISSAPASPVSRDAKRGGAGQKTSVAQAFDACVRRQLTGQRLKAFPGNRFRTQATYANVSAARLSLSLRPTKVHTQGRKLADINKKPQGSQIRVP